MAGTSQSTTLSQSYRMFITGCHILHYHGVLDAYGHLSFRDPTDPSLFVMSYHVAPGTVRSPEDLVHYRVANAEPVNPGSPKGYTERHIHSEIYKRYPGVNSVIHSHADSVIPYSITSIPMRPCYHIAGFLGSEVPVFEIEKYWKEGDIPDMLVRNEHLGAGLAEHFGPAGGRGIPRRTVVLMRGHGFSVVGESMIECVLRAVYTVKNAAIQTTTLTMQAAFRSSGANAAGNDEIRYLSDREQEGALQMSKDSMMRPWGLWGKEVEACGLYVNEA